MRTCVLALRVLVLLAATTGAPGCADAPARIRAAVVQYSAVPGSVGDNADKASGLVRAAAGRGARYIAFPELAFLPTGPGNLGERVAREAQPVPGPVTDQMVALARELDVNIAFGMAERRDGKFYNSAVFVDPSGLAGRYAKRAMVRIGPPGEVEAEVFSPGDDPGRFTWGGIPTGVLICADSGAKTLWAEIGAGDTRLLVWPKASAGASAQRAAERGAELGLPVLVANMTIPAHKHWWLFGRSAIFDAAGKPLAVSPDTRPDDVVVADVDLPVRR